MCKRNFRGLGWVGQRVVATVPPEPNETRWRRADMHVEALLLTLSRAHENAHSNWLYADDAERIGGEGVHRRLKQMPDTFSGFEALVHAESFLAASRWPDGSPARSTRSLRA